jgi:hypothetical protein
LDQAIDERLEDLVGNPKAFPRSALAVSQRREPRPAHQHFVHGFASRSHFCGHAAATVNAALNRSGL